MPGSTQDNLKLVGLGVLFLEVFGGSFFDF